MLKELLKERPWLLADGATGTNLFEVGLTSGDAPELWNVDQPEKITALHQSFVDAGSDIILTNTFGANARRLMLHKAEDRTHELNAAGAALARAVADACERDVVVAGSVGPTGDLFAPLGPLTVDEARDVFAEQIAGLKEGGADVIWIETMSAMDEVGAAADAAVAAGMDYTTAASFDTAGRTMMGVAPDSFVGGLSDRDAGPIAMGANCGVGASDTLAAILEMSAAHPDVAIISKANAGIPEFKGDQIHYSGTPELMARYAALAVGAGARIIGGCCGTAPAHIAAMRAALDACEPGAVSRPEIDAVVAATGALVAPAVEVDEAANETRRAGRRRRRS